MIVLSLYYEHEIGRVYTHKDWGVPITDHFANIHNEYAYKVIVVATEEEWIQCILDINPDAEIIPPIGDKFYWVQMD